MKTTTNHQPDPRDVAIVRAVLSTLTPAAAAVLVAALVAWCRRVLELPLVEPDPDAVTDEALRAIDHDAETAAAAIVGALFCRGMHDVARAFAAGPLGRWAVGVELVIAVRALRDAVGAPRAARRRRAA